MTRPAETLSSNMMGVSLELSRMDEKTALAFAAFGDRQQRRAAARWLKKHKTAIQKKKTT